MAIEGPLRLLAGGGAGGRGGRGGGYCEAVSRFGNFQPARGKWHVYPLG